MVQMIERLLVKMDTNQEKMDDVRMADPKTQIGSLTSSTDVNQEKEEAFRQEIEAKIEANQENIDAWLEDIKA
jgi:hypothetical protein